MEIETREDYIRRLAKNRYDMRMHFKWRLNDTEKDDWEAAVRQVENEEKWNLGHGKV
jgi:hypothetical protein